MKECNQCGKCCTKYGHGGLSATESELEFWETFRPDIFRYVQRGEIWIDPESGKQLERCPWLRRAPNKELYTCDIYLDRPDDCKFYPVTISQMVDDQCEMLEVQDLSDKKKAQNVLDKIMIDSRPAVNFD
ncbi:MAG: YkgJ family cysteine cluster protein [Gammaproteobacteria bacterium]|nr:YkgJ family cysteine cluster protein [Gammaproteobacteria bacterium]MBT3860309.1 YkgJ family cysteine cluster protein [Gammaproteobacteria bacterium]MBT3987601.1 YkgJ family cysteine cluster protein [Gammaproteobacteria bacterium]MBT4255326.1 YkgJ family cysteine cluster protein [Gammaproteobacteria bacterium]MBT4581661.1 YkgJ family cysteine cluster protein [Gammaproteobacteria bacterium]